jgi:quinol monooxygenase YgiN
VIILTGSIHARSDTIDAPESLSLAPVKRSRHEAGCVAHSVQRDVEDPLRLVFLEQWSDADGLRSHFRVPVCRAFVGEATALAAVPPQMELFAAEPATL